MVVVLSGCVSVEALVGLVNRFGGVALLTDWKNEVMVALIILLGEELVGGIHDHVLIVGVGNGWCGLQ